MSYRVDLTRDAEKQIRRLTTVTRRRVRARILALKDDPYRGAAKLRFESGYRSRVGDYRIIYQIDDKEQVVLVTGVRHRREAYR